MSDDERKRLIDALVDEANMLVRTYYSDEGEIERHVTDVVAAAAPLRTRSGFLNPPAAPDDGPSAFIQWKGTDVCLDLTCTCGFSGHYHGDFAYVLRCGGCGKEWEMPCHLYPRPNARGDDMPALDPTEEA